MKDKDAQLIQEAYNKIMENNLNLGFVRHNAPDISTVEELNRLPENSIIWYPNHDDDYGGYNTKVGLKLFIDTYNKQEDDNSQLNPQVAEQMKRDAQLLGGEPQVGFNPKDPLDGFPLICAYDGNQERLDSGEDTSPELLAFIEKTIKMGYKHFQVTYSQTFDPKFIRTYWIFD